MSGIRIQCQNGRTVAAVEISSAGARRIRIEQLSIPQAEPLSRRPEPAGLPHVLDLDELADSTLHTLPVACGCGRRSVALDTRDLRQRLDAGERRITLRHGASTRTRPAPVFCEGGFSVAGLHRVGPALHVAYLENGFQQDVPLAALDEAPTVPCRCGRTVILDPRVLPNALDADTLLRLPHVVGR
ncbi:hypothetical protein F6W70_15405 [Microbacterium maritypicum]|uniref:Uncharacterized protein n=1 Tax=Microbacterium maritypicum TaxID=33918 RepID=A0AAD3X1Y7_MICMQ|nr:hypothetical protein [Microbacterium liquefaciens]KAB1883958.1 hypothetical protein F6W70_15405 [Microbacterium liquefaciens]